MNDKSNTYMHHPTGSFSSIDLSLCHPSLFLDFNWSVCKVSNGAKIRNRYNQVPHLTQDTNGKVTNSQ